MGWVTRFHRWIDVKSRYDVPLVLGYTLTVGIRILRLRSLATPRPKVTVMKNAAGNEKKEGAPSVKVGAPRVQAMRPWGPGMCT
ncbi:hypothetical protein V6N12_037618 [Hibiscus sabdariffa]|uniref:Uncharacterized protein n=1 Tax=Hibiscus sabdariffa TaxID=183260 RepID=A0ABR2C171_9ROSI